MAIRATMPVPAQRADAYRAARWWDDRHLADGVELAAQRRPDAIAVADGERSLSWRELSREVNAGVAALVDAGVRPGAAVVWISGNTAAGAVAYHAILRTRATAIALDRRCGAADLRHALAIAGPDAVVVLPGEERARLLAGRARVRAIPLETFGQRPRRAPPRPPRASPTATRPPSCCSPRAPRAGPRPSSTR
jgi:non-ribosomal peptide synthetase component E (peptide arylation enzyme)